MCGICGAVQQAESMSASRLRQMNDTLQHRGPDGEGLYLEGGVGLAMRRLSIIDVAGSDQPLYNEDKTIALVFNGEIYNYRELRQQLQAQGHRFHTEGDGETIAHLYEQYGTDAPKHLRGMFGFALWDSKTQRLFIARDRYGQKPMYFYHDSENLVFGSEIKALLAHPTVPCESAFSDARHLALYLAYGYLPAPLTAFKQIHALLPAHYLVWEAGKLRTAPYWDIPQINAQASNASAETYLGDLRDLLQESVSLRMISDVPLGAFLSGGLDSSLIVALMQKATNQTVKTFSIGFAGDKSFDESPYAQQVADTLGTEHTNFTVEAKALELLPKLVWHHDQPFADSSAIPTYLVSQLTRQHVTVALTGDGGDEQFAGYERFYAALLTEKLGLLPRPIWQMASKMLALLPEGTAYYNPLKRAGRFAKAAALPFALAYFDLVRVASAEMVHDLCGTVDYAGQDFSKQLRHHNLANLLEANQRTYLPDDLLIKTDRCSMAASLEARNPFLDHELAAYVATIPPNLKLKGKTTKYILKEAARGLLPDSIIDRPKHGFGVPIGAWLRQDSSLVRDWLLSAPAKGRGLLNTQAVETLIQEHETGKRDNNRILWSLLTLEAWHQGFMS